jgi:hypothetical protein
MVREIMKSKVAALLPGEPEGIGQMGIGAGGDDLVINITVALKAGRQTRV